MTHKKYTIALDGLPDHESIIFKLICSVSERTKNRTNAYALTSVPNSADISINDIKNKITKESSAAHPLQVWISDKQENLDNAISRPLIATRVLHTLDNLIENIEPAVEENNIPIKEETASIDLNITEEEASELAIVHDEILENPANLEEPEPAANNVELTLIKNNTQNTPSTARTQRVLVVDDSPSVRKQLEIELEYFDVSVDFADCAEAAFELINTNEYDMTLLDVVLPDKDGFQICKHVKAKNKATIAIMLTGRATQADKIKGSLAGCNAYLVKPVGRVTFQNAVKNHISMKNTKTAIEA